MSSPLTTSFIEVHSRKKIQGSKIESKISERVTIGHPVWLHFALMAVVGEETDRARSCSTINWCSWVLYWQETIWRPFSGIRVNGYRRQEVMKSLRPILLLKMTAYSALTALLRSYMPHTRASKWKTLNCCSLGELSSGEPSLRLVVSNMRDSNDSRCQPTLCTLPFVCNLAWLCFNLGCLLFLRSVSFFFQDLPAFVSKLAWFCPSGLPFVHEICVFCFPYTPWILSHGPDDVFYCLAD